MGTERLKEQYNLLLNEQKNKMDKLKQKRLMNNNQEKATVKNVLLLVIYFEFCNFFFTKFDSISSNIYDDNEYELDLKDDLDNDMFLKLNDPNDSSDDEKPRLSKSNKLLLKVIFSLLILNQIFKIIYLFFCEIKRKQTKNKKSFKQVVQMEWKLYANRCHLLTN